MNQKKTGAFLKELRKEKGLTQEQFAEIFYVSNRTVSRWETGNNMPDLDILIQISDYYEVELREILNGERKSENMDKELEETVLKAVDYTNENTEKYTKRVNWLLVLGVIFWLIAQFINHTGLNDIYVLSAIADFSEGATCGIIICGLIATSILGQKLKSFKQRIFKKSE